MLLCKIFGADRMAEKRLLSSSILRFFRCAHFLEPFGGPANEPHPFELKNPESIRDNRLSRSEWIRDKGNGAYEIARLPWLIQSALYKSHVNSRLSLQFLSFTYPSLILPYPPCALSSPLSSLLSSPLIPLIPSESASSVCCP